MGCSAKIQGQWVGVSKIFRRESGEWTEISESDFSSIASVTSFEYGGHYGAEYSDEPYNPSGTHEPNQNIIYTETEGKPNVKTDENGNVVEYKFTDSAEIETGVDTGIVAFDGSDFEIYLKATIDASELTSASAAPIINIRKDSNSNLYGVTLSCTYISSAQIMASSNSAGLRMNAVTYSGTSSTSKWMRMTNKIGNYYYYFGVRVSDGPTTYIYRIVKSGSTITVRVYDENDEELIGVPMTSSTSGEFEFSFDPTFDDVTIEIGHSTSRQGADQYCKMTVLEFETIKK